MKLGLGLELGLELRLSLGNLGLGLGFAEIRFQSNVFLSKYNRSSAYSSETHL